MHSSLEDAELMNKVLLNFQHSVLDVSICNVNSVRYDTGYQGTTTSCGDVFSVT